jgi:uncharacterized membrane protein YfcA
MPGMPAGAESWIVFGLVVVLAHLLQSITGFGAVVLTLSVLAFLFPVKFLVPVLVSVSLIQVVWFAVAGRRSIRWGHAKIILFFSLVGLPLGYLVFRFLPAGVLKIAVGAFVVLVAVANLTGMRINIRIPRLCYYLLNLLGGFFQGALGAGGPLLIIYAGLTIEDKAAFRATLAIVWIALNSILCTIYLATGGFTESMLPLVGLGIACMVLGTVLGMRVHARIPQKPFRMLVYMILLISGLALLLPLS